MKYDDLHDEEVRVTDATTGGQKGVKVTQIGALDPVALLIMGRVGGIGTLKYDAFNFLKGYDWANSFNAGMRHAMLFWAGEDTDWCTTEGHPVRQQHPYEAKDRSVDGERNAEGTGTLYGIRKACNGTGQPHVAMAAWHFHALTGFQARGIGTDKRPPKLEPERRAIEDVVKDLDRGIITRSQALAAVGADPLSTVCMCVRLGMREHRIDCPLWRP